MLQEKQVVERMYSVLGSSLCCQKEQVRKTMNEYISLHPLLNHTLALEHSECS